MHLPRLLNITMPVFNRPELTRAALESIRSMRSPVPYVVTVVDNGSDAETVGMLLRLKALGCIDTLLLCDSNLGVSCAANLGWQAVDSDLYMKWDNDIRLLDPDWLHSVFARWGKVDPVSTIADCWFEALYAEGEKIDTDAGELRLCPNNLQGSALLVPREVRDRLGYWNEDYGLYGAEDGDYGLRMRTAGYPQYYFRSEGLFVDMGKDYAETYLARGIDKLAQMNAAYNDGDTQWGLFNLNALLYTLGVRSLKVPLKYELAGVNPEHKAIIRISRRYRHFRKGLLLCQELVQSMCPGDGQTARLSRNAVARLRSILREHGDNAV